MKNTGIKVWVLTGDKIETAVNIGFSAGLLDNDMKRFEIQEVDEESLKESIKSYLAGIDSYGTQKKAIVVAGDSLAKIDSSD